ncbi:MAG: dihydrofolate reductase [Bacteroidia bacterium]|nr:dihydrofolate reductase [Bacteroidia bacterium]
MNTSDFTYKVDRFADIEVLRYLVPDFEKLTLKQKILIYYLSEAALCGRDILFDQNNQYNLWIRKTLENIYINYVGNRNCPEFLSFEEYLKRIWFSNGIHHHYSTNKIEPSFNEDYFEHLLKSINFEGDENLLKSLIFNKNLAAKRVNLEQNTDLITSSANNFYRNITQKETEDFYASITNPNDKTPISYGLNSRLEKAEDDTITEKVWKLNGEYSKAIVHIIAHLDSAMDYAENEKQKQVIQSLIEFYKSGDLKKFDEYSILWVEDTVSQVDFVNGFIETYGDPLGYKASWESIVNFRNEEATKRTHIISKNAQWFEDHSPINKEFKKETVRGVSAKVITNAMLGGDCYPATPIGINLPNANWIRQIYGSKSVTIENIMEAYNKASYGNGFAEEFYDNDQDIQAWYTYGFATDVLHTDLHECLGHGSGQLLPGVSQDALKAYGATLEEARADLFGLYYMADPIMMELNLLPNVNAYKAAYYRYLLNGLMTQSVRISIGENIEESHMRNRQLIAKYVYEKGLPEKVAELINKNGKTYLVINDYERLRQLFGDLLAEVQRIKSEGDYEAGKDLVEKYAIKINPELHKEAIERYKKLDIAPYRGFVNPVYLLKKDSNGKIIDVVPTYEEDFVEQMLRYSKYYSFL